MPASQPARARQSDARLRVVVQRASGALLADQDPAACNTSIN